jgi:segregation and condensation protein B
VTNNGDLIVDHEDVGIHATVASPAKPIAPIEAFEAALFVGSVPIDLNRLRKLFPLMTIVEFDGIAAELADRYVAERRPYQVVKTDDRYRLGLKVEFTESIGSRRKKPDAKLTREAIEVLSIVAYKQPIAPSAVEDIWGRDPTSTIRSLLGRRLIEHDSANGERSDKLRTSDRFLRLFGLDSLADLPKSDDLSRR